MNVRASLHLSRRSVVLAGLVGTLPRSGWAAEPQRIMVFGDSQAQGLAAGVMRLYRGDRSRRVLDRSKIGSGLLPRPNSYDWPAQAKVLAAERPSLAVALFGANDRPNVRIGGEIDPDRFTAFHDSYTDTVSSIAHAFAEAGVPLVWVGHPVVKDPVFNADMELVNEIFEERATAEGAVFVSTGELFKGPDGEFSAYGKGVDGQTTRLRADDGVHLTPAGYDVLAALLAPLFDHPPSAAGAPPA